jgi:hypothetical protein
MATPCGLDQVINQLSDATDESARRIVQHLTDVLAEEGRSYHLETCVDAPSPQLGFTLQPLPSKQRLRSTSPETAWLCLAENISPSTEEMVELLHSIWKQTEITRLRIARGEPPRQLTAPWERNPPHEQG